MTVSRFPTEKFRYRVEILFGPDQDGRDAYLFRLVAPWGQPIIHALPTLAEAAPVAADIFASGIDVVWERTP